ncbi:expressed protein [Phakopsora pachyrhizi]|uniref:Expressed protein n=1 Tax=Phakopsora pachyrhizi TaxID=170000 RepID=A0AAV0BCG5_PHAPC|nr:expressed protein [Phakopsora pachyrhizi]
MVVVNPEIHDRILESPKINFSISCKNEDIILQDKLVPTSVIVKTIQNDHNIQKSVNTAISQINSSEITNIKHTDSCSPQLTEKKTLDDAKRKKYFFEATNNATEVDNVSSDSSVNSICARECLQKGVEAHQNDDMINSARWFEQSAKKDGGCGMGMLMWALSLRHGWGCEIDKVKAYGWLQMAAENLLLELNHLSLKRDSYANFRPQEVKFSSELLLTVYELGQCIMHGWGCEKDKALAFQYYKVAAIHGDPDAQKELAYCYEVGRGVKKSYKEAAKFYRMAFNQGNPIMGYQWVWKEKVQNSLNYFEFRVRLQFAT